MPSLSAPVFISYSREDSTFALQLAKDLKASGLPVWMDQLDITPGEKWDVAVEAALANALRVLVLLSPASVQSASVMDEVSFALDERKIVIPVIHSDCKIPLRLRRLQHIDLRTNRSQGVTEIMNVLSEEHVAAKANRGSNFEFDVHISYAHLDNIPLTAEEGWISRFRASLEARLSVRLGRNVRISLDTKLSGNDYFVDDLSERIRLTTLLVIVLSPSYISSEWCNRELQEFCNAAELTGGIVSNQRSRVFKVIKTPVDYQESLPAVVKETQGYQFYRATPDGRAMDLDPAFGSEYAQEFNLRMEELSSDIAAMITSLDADSTSQKDT